VAAFVVSLIAGIWMLAMGGMMGWGNMGGWSGGGHMTTTTGPAGGAGYGDWMWQHHEMMHGYGGGIMWSWIGFAAGIIVLVGAVAVYTRPVAARNWGIVILIVSAVDLLAGVGGFLAGILGIIGGILAITWKPQAQ